ncbi:hypothetical protein J437_LFUL003677, partial [Ladona fulva]
RVFKRTRGCDEVEKGFLGIVGRVERRRSAVEERCGRGGRKPSRRGQSALRWTPSYAPHAPGFDPGDRLVTHTSLWALGYPRSACEGVENGEEEQDSFGPGARPPDLRRDMHLPAHRGTQYSIPGLPLRRGVHAIAPGVQLGSRPDAFHLQNGLHGTATDFLRLGLLRRMVPHKDLRTMPTDPRNGSEERVDIAIGRMYGRRKCGLPPGEAWRPAQD